MRQESEILKDHCDLSITELLQVFVSEGHDVDTIDDHFPRRRFQQTIYVPDEGRLAAAGEPHDAENLTAPDIETDVGDPDHRVIALEKILLGVCADSSLGKDGISVLAEDLPDIADLDDRAVLGRACHGWRGSRFLQWISRLPPEPQWRPASMPGAIARSV